MKGLFGKMSVISSSGLVLGRNWKSLWMTLGYLAFFTSWPCQTVVSRVVSPQPEQWRWAQVQQSSDLSLAVDIKGNGKPLCPEVKWQVHSFSNIGQLLPYSPEIEARVNRKKHPWTVRFQSKDEKEPIGDIISYYLHIKKNLKTVGLKRSRHRWRVN